jgi:putative drug exporter of the RND superfamily
MTAFATVTYDKRASQLQAGTGKPVLRQVNAIHLRGLQVAAGGQVIKDADGFSVGPATAAGVIAALAILLLTFGSLTAAGMPLITAGLGLITSLGLIGLMTRARAKHSICLLEASGQDSTGL